MADNYLERQMEDYRAGRLSTSAVVPSRRRDLTAWVDIAPDPDLTVDVVSSLRMAGVRVAFTLDDMRRGNEVAQSTGARYYPRRVAARAVSDYKQFDITITR